MEKFQVGMTLVNNQGYEVVVASKFFLLGLYGPDGRYWSAVTLAVEGFKVQTKPVAAL